MEKGAGLETGQGPGDGAPEVGGPLVWGGAEGRTVGRCLWSERKGKGSGLGARMRI